MTDVIDKMIKAICSMPVKLAASMDADNLEDVAKDCAKLQEALFKITSASYGSFCIGDVFAAMGPPIPEEVLSMASQVSAVCDSIKSVNILSPYVAAKLTTTNVPLLKFIVTPEEFAKAKQAAQMKLAAQQGEMQEAMGSIGELSAMQSIISTDTKQLTAGIRHAVNVFNVADR